MAKIISVVSQTNIRVNTSLDKEELKNINKVSSSPVFSNENNWRLAIGIFKHTDSRRRMVCAFKGDFNSLVPMRIRPGTQAGDTYELRKILIVSQNNQGILSIPRAEIASASDYDFVIGEVATPENFSATISSNASESVYAAFSASISFNKSVSNFDLTKLSITNGTASSMSGSGSSYSFTVTPNGEGQVSISILAGQVTAADGSVNTVSNSLQRQYYAPVSASISTANGGSSFSESFTINVVFNKSVTNFDVTNVMVTNGTAGSFNGSGANYNFLVTPTQDGPVSVDLDMEDVVGEDGSTSSTPPSPVNASYISPLTVSMTSDVPATVNGSFTVNIIFNKSVTGFELSDLSITNGVASNLTGSGANYSFTVTPNADGAVSVSLSSGAAIQGPSGESNSSASNAISTTYVDLKTLNLSSTGGNGLGTVSALLNNQTVFSSRPLTQTQSVSYDFQPGDDVQLSAEADIDNYFAGYNGSITSSSHVSSLIMNDDKNISASFNKSFNTVHKAVHNPKMNYLSNGKILAYGSVDMMYNDLYCNFMVLNSDKSIDTSFPKANFNGTVNDVAIDSSGNYWVVGSFTSYSGPMSAAATAAGFASGQANNANRIAKLNSSGELLKISTGDVAGLIGNGFNSTISCIAIDSGNNVWVGGSFTSYYGDVTWGTKGVVYNAVFIAKLNSSGELLKISAGDVAGYSSNGFNAAVSCITIDSSNNVWVGGSFTQYDGDISASWPSGAKSAAGNANRIAKLNSSGQLLKISAVDTYNKSIVSSNYLITPPAGGALPDIVNDTRTNANKWYFNSIENTYWIGTNSSPTYSTGSYNNVSTISHIYTNINVSISMPVVNFKAWVGGEGSFDTLSVRVVDASTSNPTGGLLYTTGTTLGSISSIVNTAGFRDYSIDLSSAITNGVSRAVKIVFTWKNDTTVSNSPGARINELTISNGSSNGFNGAVSCIAIDSGNNVWVGGSFTQYYGDTIYNNLSNPEGGVFSRWSPNSANYIAKLNSLGVQQKISTNDLPGTTVGLRANGFNALVNCITIDSGNNVWVGGGFTMWRGKTNAGYGTDGASNNANRISKLNSSGELIRICSEDKVGLNLSYSKQLTSLNGVDSNVLKISFNNVGDALISGGFLESYFDNKSCTVHGIVSLIKDQGLHYPDFSLNFNSYNTQFRNLNPLIGSGVGGGIQSKHKKMPDGKIITFGSFRIEQDGSIWRNIVRLESYTEGGVFDIDEGFFGGGFNGTVNDVAIDSSGNYWVVGSFTSYSGPMSAAATAAGFASGQSNNANNIAKLNSLGQLLLINSSDYSLDASSGNGFNGNVSCITIDSGNNVWVGGSFSQYNGAATWVSRGTSNNARYIAKLNSSGQLLKISAGDTASSTGNGFNGTVSCITVDSSNNVWVGGNFSLYYGDVTWGTKGTARNANYIAKLNSSGQLLKISAGDTASSTGNGFDYNINCITIDSGNNVWVGGVFYTYYGDVTWETKGAAYNATFIAKLNSSGELLKISAGDTASSTGNGFNGTVSCITVDSSNNVWVGGSFSLYNGDVTWGTKGTFYNASRIAKLNSSGQLLKIVSTDPDQYYNVVGSFSVHGIMVNNNDIWLGSNVSSIQPKWSFSFGVKGVETISNRPKLNYLVKPFAILHEGSSLRTR